MNRSGVNCVNYYTLYSMPPEKVRKLLVEGNGDMTAAFCIDISIFRLRKRSKLKDSENTQQPLIALRLIRGR